MQNWNIITTILSIFVLIVLITIIILAVIKRKTNKQIAYYQYSKLISDDLNKLFKKKKVLIICITIFSIIFTILFFTVMGFVVASTIHIYQTQIKPSN